MKNNFIILAIFTLLTTQAFSRGSPPPRIPEPTPTPTPAPTIKGARFSPVYNYTVEEKEVLAISERLTNELFQSKCFEDFMMKRKLIDTAGKTPIEVVRHLKTLDLSVPVHMYSKWWSNVVGYRQPPAPDIYTNRKFHAGATACSRGSNLAHEWSHSGGYDHSFNATPSRPFSVPYSINAAFEVCCACRSVKDCSIKILP